MFNRNQQIYHDTRKRPTPLQNEALEYVVAGVGSMTSVFVLINRTGGVLKSVDPVREHSGKRPMLNFH